MHLRPQLSSIRARFGYPYHQWATQDLDEAGWKLIQRNIAQKRAHDVTLLVEGPDGRFVLTSRHSYPPGHFRTSSSGVVRPGEDLATGALREVMEETGLKIELKRFLLHVTLDIAREDEVLTWDSFVFYATTQDTELKLTDSDDAKEMVWAGREHLQTLVSTLCESGNGGLIYRGNVISSSLWALDNPLLLREATPRDKTGINYSLLANCLEVEDNPRTFWWIAEVHDFSSGTVGIKVNDDCAELTGLTVDPLYRGKGVGHAMADYACDVWADPAQRRKLLERVKLPFGHEKLWLTTDIPAYFLPVNFVLTEPALLPRSLREQLTDTKAWWKGMRYQLYNF